MSAQDDERKLCELSLLMYQIYAIADLIHCSGLTQPKDFPSALGGSIDAIREIARHGYRVAYEEDPA